MRSGRGFLDGDAEALDLVGQAREGGGDAVLGEDLGGVEVGAELEGDGDGELAVAGGLAAHVEHVLGRR